MAVPSAANRSYPAKANHIRSVNISNVFTLSCPDVRMRTKFNKGHIFIDVVYTKWFESILTC